MRCHYLSDLHLDAQPFTGSFAEGDVLIIAGDLCNASCLDPARKDRYAVIQRGRVLRLLEQATRKFTEVLVVAGNHEHYDGSFHDTVSLMRAHLPCVRVLDNKAVEIGGVRFFGSTLWTDFNGGNQETMDRVRREVGDYFFIDMARGNKPPKRSRFQPEDALAQHLLSWEALISAVAAEPSKQTVVISHHAPSRLGLNRQFAGKGLDPAFASSLDDEIAQFENVPVWVHGHTHIAKTYSIGRTSFRTNALGFAERGHAAPGFSLNASFEVG